MKRQRINLRLTPLGDHELTEPRPERPAYPPLSARVPALGETAATAVARRAGHRKSFMICK